MKASETVVMLGNNVIKALFRKRRTLSEVKKKKKIIRRYIILQELQGGNCISKSTRNHH